MWSEWVTRLMQDAALQKDHSSQPSPVSGRAQDWQNVLWREWRNCEDEEYAGHLFKLVADELSLDWRMTTLITLLGTLAGAVGGLLVGFVDMAWVTWSKSGQDATSWTVLLICTGAGSLVGGIIGVMAPMRLRAYHTWRVLFFRLRVGLAVGLISLLLGGPIAGLVGGLIAGWASVPIAKWRGFDPSHFDPLRIGLVLGLIAGLITELVYGGWAGVAIGVFVGFVSWPALAFIVAAHGPGGKIGALFDAWRREVSEGQQPIPLIEQFIQHRHRHWYFWWREQPVRVEVEKALWEARAAHGWARGVWTRPLHRLEERQQGPEAPDQLIDDLQNEDWVERFTARHTLIALGGKAVQPLQSLVEDQTDSLGRLAVTVLKEIGFETTTRWVGNASTSLCLQCLARCCAHRAHLPWQPDVTYYGCRICHQSQAFIHCPQGVVVVLDTAWTGMQEQQNGLLRVNWLTRRALFDFDRVEIILATDEDVERFAIQVGNDTDPYRKPRYQQMPCIVKPGCELSENTWRVLDSMFGQVGRTTAIKA